MRRSLVPVLASFMATTLLGGCARTYESFYRETETELRPKPVPAEQVQAVRSADHLQTAWTELGRYTGHAPTVKEAMEAAKHACGRAGANVFILRAEPFTARGVWKVVGLCAVKGPASSEPSANPSANPNAGY